MFRRTMQKSLLLLVVTAWTCQAGIILDSNLPDSHVPINPSKPVTHTDVNYTKPWFCHDLDCPKYSVLESNDKFEVRHYEPSVWVATKLTTMVYTKTQNSAMFFKLFHYISGNNSAHMKIPMTAPVVTEVLHGQGPDCESNFTMYFMIPYNMQANPPTPTESDVMIVRQDAFTVFVKSYGGYSTDDIKRVKLEEFTHDLDAANKTYKDNMFFTAGYDGPYSFINRHNELWVVA